MASAAVPPKPAHAPSASDGETVTSPTCSVTSRRELGGASAAVEVHVGDARLLRSEVIMDGGHCDVLVRELREHRLELGTGQDEIAHHHGVRGRSAEAGPRAERERRRDGHVADMQRDIAARQVIAVIAAGERCGSLQDGAHRVPRRLTAGGLCD